MAEYTRLAEEKDITWFLDTVLVRDIRAAINSGAGYLAFGLIAEAIEVLGALLDEHELEQPGESENRFGKAITKSFAPIDVRYEKYNRKDSQFYLYENLRCGMAHILRPKSKLLFTGFHDAQKLKAKHLDEIGFQDGETYLLLVIEVFHDHLKEACRRTLNHIKKKTHAKLSKGYITVSAVDEPKGPISSVGNFYLSGGPLQANISGVAPGTR